MPAPIDSRTPLAGELLVLLAGLAAHGALAANIILPGVPGHGVLPYQVAYPRLDPCNEDLDDFQ